MKLTIKAESLEAPLKAIKGVIGEINIQTTDEGLLVKSRNKENCAAVIYKVSKTLFTEYVPSEEGIGVKLESQTVSKQKFPGLYDIIKSAKKGSLITIEEDKGKLIILVNGREYGMGILTDVKGEKLGGPEIDYPTVINMDTAKLSEIIEDGFLDAEESLLFSYDEGNLSIFYEQGINTLRDKIEVSEVVTDKKARSKYSVAYLRNMVSTITDKVKVSFGDDYMLRLDYISPEFELSFILACRVENT